MILTKEGRNMYPEFAYSRAMQFVLAMISFISAHIFVYCIANVILFIHGEKATSKQKHIFAFWVGGILNTAWTYAVYFIGGMNSFSQTVYALVVTPNPVFALLYYLIGEKVLKLPPLRSVKLMGHVFIFYIIIKSFNRLLGSILFTQPSGRYNYMVDSFQQITLFVVILAIFFVANRALKHNANILALRDSLFVNFKIELAIYFAKSTMIYLIMVMVPMFIPNNIMANLVVFAVLALILALTILLDMYGASKNDVANKDAHISVLSKSIDEFSGVKHDFYNILQTYGGYLEVENLDGLRQYHQSLLNLTVRTGEATDLRQKMNENPALVSLLIDKCDYAERMSVKASIELHSSLCDLSIDNIDVCRAVGCLLDNAIEAAAISEKKKVSFAVEPKQNGGKLLIISNSTASPVDTNQILLSGVTSKPGHLGKGLVIVREIVGRYGNCTFRLAYYHYEFSVYIEIRQSNLLLEPCVDASSGKLSPPSAG